MTIESLLQESIKDLKVSELHLLHKAMLEECCENALNNDQGITELPTLVYAVRVAFLTCNNMMKNTINTALQHADIVNLNYRGLHFQFDKSSPFLQ